MTGLANSLRTQGPRAPSSQQCPTVSHSNPHNTYHIGVLILNRIGNSERQGFLDGTPRKSSPVFTQASHDSSHPLQPLLFFPISHRFLKNPTFSLVNRN